MRLYCGDAELKILQGFTLTADTVVLPFVLQSFQASTWIGSTYARAHLLLSPCHLTTKLRKSSHRTLTFIVEGILLPKFRISCRDCIKLMYDFEVVFVLSPETIRQISLKYHNIRSLSQIRTAKSSSYQSNATTSL
jgi:hypothetical protein